MFQVGRYPLEQENMFNFTRNQILESVNNSLNLLGVDYIDLIQVIHSVFFIRDTLKWGLECL